MITYDDFAKVDICVGKIIKVEDFPEARKPAYKIWIDFGAEVDAEVSSAQITKHYTKDELIGRQIIGVVNFSSKQIGPFKSEVLTLGLTDENGDAVIVSRPRKYFWAENYFNDYGIHETRLA